MNDSSLRGFLRFISGITWGRFWLISFLAFTAAGLLTGLVAASSVGLNPAPVMPLFSMLWVGVLTARIVFRGNPEFNPAQPAADDQGDDVPPPGGRWARAAWFLARLSWPRFFLISLLFLAVAGILSDLVSPPRRSSGGATAPVEIRILHDKDKQGKEITSIIRVGPDGVESSRKPSKASGNGEDANVRIDGDGIRIEKKDGSGEVVSIGPSGIRIQKPDGTQTKTITLPGVTISVNAKDAQKAASAAQGAASTSSASSAPSAARSAAEAAQAKADAETAKADAEAAKAEAEANAADASDEADGLHPRIITIDPNAPESIGRQVERALKKAHTAIEGQVRSNLDREYADEHVIHWDEVMMILAVTLVIMSTILKLMAGSQYRARVAAYRATQRAEGEALQRQLSEAQLKAMQAQVEPHFLFNTLASVDYLIETNPKRASTMQKNLIAYLRAALPQMREAATTLGREVKLAASYLEILKVRMEERLSYSVEVPDGLNGAEFPPMMLQTLVENAIKHGLEPKPEGGSISIRAEVRDGALRVSVADTGVGLAATGAAPTRGTGLGLSNIRDRLTMLYPGRARLVLEANLPSGTLATIEIPYKAG